MRFLLATIIFVSMALAACGGESGQGKALSATLAYFGDDPRAVPPVGVEYACGITVAEQPPSPAPTIPAVAGSCRWDVLEQGESWHVTFKERWACRDFRRDAPPYPTCPPTSGFHQWDFVVDSSFHVSALPDDGNFAPDMTK